MFELINEPIEVVVSFSTEKPTPLHFIWKNRFYKIKLVNFVHTSYEGDDLLYNFAVSTDTEAYKLVFNTKKLYWILKEVYSDGFARSKSLNDKSYLDVSYTKSEHNSGRRIKKASYISHRL